MPLTATPGLIMQKARRHPEKRNLPRREEIPFSKLRLIVGAWFQVLFHSHHLRPFHLSLTVLSALSVIGTCLALEGGPPGFPQDFPCPMVLGNTVQRVPLFLPTGLSPSKASLSRRIRLIKEFVTLRSVRDQTKPCPTTPLSQHSRVLTQQRFRLFPSSLAATEGISVDFFSSGY